VTRSPAAAGRASRKAVGRTLARHAVTPARVIGGRRAAYRAKSKERRGCVAASLRSVPKDADHSKRQTGRCGDVRDGELRDTVGTAPAGSSMS
jgi:hypothetical protein